MTGIFEPFPKIIWKTLKHLARLWEILGILFTLPEFNFKSEREHCNVTVEMLWALCEFWEQEKHAVFLKFGQLYLSRAAKCIRGHCMNLEIWGYTGMGIGNEFQGPEKHKHISTFASVCNPLPVEKDEKYITAMYEQPYIFS